MKLILLGPPGAGKGTQAARIAERLSVPVVSTGEILRAAIKDETELGALAKGYLDAGELVPDDIIIGIMRGRLQQKDCEGGFILDGVPRTLEQAAALEQMGVDIDRVIDLEVDDAEIVSRLSGRRVCPSCKAIYHIESEPPAVADICDVCGAALEIREDDKPETILERLRVYHDQTEPLRSYYKKAGKLRSIDGTGDINDVTRLALAALEG